jgi:AAA+ ATPase superfamily predicted ATPase
MPDSLVQQDSYVGPRPFETEEEKKFFGREREINEIVSLIIANRLLLMYAASGAGKTSLINAGVIPSLRNEGFDLFSAARFEVVPHNLKDGKNAYVLSAVRRIAEAERDFNPDTLSHTTLAEFFKKPDADRDTSDEATLRILIFDQFEEIFTSIPPDWQDRREFFRQIDGFGE